MADVRAAGGKRQRAPKLRKGKRAKQGLSSLERDRLRNEIFRRVCSVYWLDRSMHEVERLGLARKLSVSSEMSQRGIYPPRAENTPMRTCRCRQCREWRLWPPQYINSRGFSVECAYQMMSDEEIEGLAPSASKLFVKMTRSGPIATKL